MTEVTTSVNESEWRSFLDTCDAASIYYTPEWKHFIEKTFNYKSNYLFAKDENGNVNGLLPLFFVKSKLTGNRLSSVPFSHTCGYIGSNDYKESLIYEGINAYTKLDLNYLEIRDEVKIKGFQLQNSFSTYILKLLTDIDKIWYKLEKKSARWAVKRSKTIGVQVESTNKLEDLRDFYELNCITKRAIGVPCHPWKFFKNMFKSLNKNILLYIARYNGEAIGGGVFWYFKDQAIYAYGAAHPDHLKLYPYNAFIWKSIEDACLNGYTCLDFGRTSYDNEGLINFKKRWGTNEVKLYYSYYPEKMRSPTVDRKDFKYQYGRKLIQKMPLPIYNKLSNSLFQHFG